LVTGPLHFLLGRETATMLPTSLRVLTAAGVLLAGERQVVILAGRDRQRATECGGDVGNEGETGTPPVPARVRTIAASPRGHSASIRGEESAVNSRHATRARERGQEGDCTKS